MTHDLAHTIRRYIHEQMHPFELDAKAPEPPPPPPPQPAQKKVVEERSELQAWAAKEFKLATPITPILCLDVHPFLHKVIDALTKYVATASLITLEKIDAQLFDNPLFQILLVPIDQIKEIPLLRQRLPHPAPHKLEASLFPLEKIEVYLHDETKKRDLWENLKRMPLSS